MQEDTEYNNVSGAVDVMCVVEMIMCVRVRVLLWCFKKNGARKYGIGARLYTSFTDFGFSLSGCSMKIYAAAPPLTHFSPGIPFSCFFFTLLSFSSFFTLLATYTHTHTLNNQHHETFHCRWFSIVCHQFDGCCCAIPLFG